jgi:hypothetical protein
MVNAECRLVVPASYFLDTVLLLRRPCIKMTSDRFGVDYKELNFDVLTGETKPVETMASAGEKHTSMYSPQASEDNIE